MPEVNKLAIWGSLWGTVPTHDDTNTMISASPNYVLKLYLPVFSYSGLELSLWIRRGRNMEIYFINTDVHLTFANWVL